MYALSTIAKPIHAKLIGNDVTFTSVSTDTRTLQPGALFIALQGPQFDAHDFLAEAAQKGAVAAMVSREVTSTLPLLKVADTRLGLGHLAAWHRQQFSLPMVGLTGSAGKTTTKHMIAAILSQAGATLATEGTLNNDIGVPLTLLRLAPQHRYAVIEMGANHHGEIQYVAEIAKPNVALITNAGPAHLEGFGDLPGVARAKGEIFQALPRDGIAIINADDAFCDFWQQQNKAHRILRFGRNNSAEFTAKQISFDAQGCAQFIMVTPVGEVNVHLRIMGEHNIMNALAASAAAHAVDVPLAAMQAGLNSVEPVNKRLVIYKTTVGAEIIDDSYNANPSSVTAAIQLLSKRTGKKILALGDMRELGPDAAKYHQQIGEKAKQEGIDQLFAYGELSAFTVQAFGKNGYHFNTQPELIAALKPRLQADVTVLVKGSLSTRMSHVVAALKEE